LISGRSDFFNAGHIRLRGLNQDLSEVVQCFKLSADQGNAVTQDVRVARLWIQLAASSNDAEATGYFQSGRHPDLNEFLFETTRDALTGQVDTTRYLTMQVDQGHAEGQCRLSLKSPETVPRSLQRCSNLRSEHCGVHETLLQNARNRAGIWRANDDVFNVQG
jgi:hypothetical protein